MSITTINLFLNPGYIYSALDQLVPSSLVGKTGQEAVVLLKQNNLSLAHSVLDLYYRIKRNIEYLSQGKESLYPVNPRYPTNGINKLNARSSRQYFYLIHHYSGLSFGAVANLAAFVIQNNKIRYEQNRRALQGPKFL